ncbi:glycosyltransferase [candidate division WWE3 bacterium]|uniref:Glycosyltransferase n=1 Tax=candidate division WWE3 bacterium TaxID=2053526 RepID=A0A955LVI3_UNCKA|nr:glycosyltransferase [candidate division WWE3 bacterium]
MKKITVVIPCHNEERGIAKVLDEMPVQKLVDAGYSTEVIVIDNNSTDKTIMVAQEKGARIICESKQGKGNALVTGFEAVTDDTDYVVMMDGDATYKPQELLRLVEPLDSGFCDVVVGSRLAGKTHKYSLRFRNRIANWFYTFLVRYFYLANVTDVLSGYLAWKKTTVDIMVPHLNARGFAIEMEMITKMKRLGFEMYSVPITYDTREGDTKINALQDGIKILSMFFKNFLWKPVVLKERHGKPHVVKVVSYAHPFTGSGLGNVAQKQAEYLATNGYHVSLVSSNYPKSKSVFLLNNVQHVKIPALHFLMRFHVPVPIPFITPTLIRLIKSADIVHIHDVLYPMSFLSVLLAKLFRKPIVLTQHVPFVEYPQLVLNGIQRIALATMGSITFAFSDRIIVLNEVVKSMLHTHAEKVVLLPNGVDTVFFSPVDQQEKEHLRDKHGFDTSRHIVLFVGRLVPKKGYEIVFDLTNESYTILCVGAGVVPEGMQNNPHIKFLGNKTQNELREYYQLSDVFVLPSYGEGFPLVIQEAMASGLPIITTDQEEYHQYVDKDFVRLVPRDKESFQKAIEEILNNRDVRNTMSMYSRQTALGMFSWRDNAEKIAEIYQGLLEGEKIFSSEYIAVIEEALTIQSDKRE